MEKPKKNRRAKEPTVSYNFRLTPMEYNTLQILSAKRGLTMASWIRSLIHEHGDNLERNKLPFEA